MLISVTVNLLVTYLNACSASSNLPLFASQLGDSGTKTRRITQTIGRVPHIAAVTCQDKKVPRRWDTNSPKAMARDTAANRNPLYLGSDVSPMKTLDGGPRSPTQMPVRNRPAKIMEMLEAKAMVNQPKR